MICAVCQTEVLEQSIICSECKCEYHQACGMMACEVHVGYYRCTTCVSPKDKCPLCQFYANDVDPMVFKCVGCNEKYHKECLIAMSIKTRDATCEYCFII